MYISQFVLICESEASNFLILADFFFRIREISHAGIRNSLLVFLGTGNFASIYLNSPVYIFAEATEARLLLSKTSFEYRKKRELPFQPTLQGKMGRLHTPNRFTLPQSHKWILNLNTERMKRISVIDTSGR